MITRTIQGVPFRVISPSFYELAAHPEVDVSFIGDRWALQFPVAGEPFIACFPTLNDAAAMIAEAMTLTT